MRRIGEWLREWFWYGFAGVMALAFLWDHQDVYLRWLMFATVMGKLTDIEGALRGR